MRTRLRRETSRVSRSPQPTRSPFREPGQGKLVKVLFTGKHNEFGNVMFIRKCRTRNRKSPKSTTALSISRCANQTQRVALETPPVLRLSLFIREAILPGNEGSRENGSGLIGAAWPAVFPASEARRWNYPGLQHDFLAAGSSSRRGAPCAVRVLLANFQPFRVGGFADRAFGIRRTNETLPVPSRRPLHRTNQPRPRGRA